MRTLRARLVAYEPLGARICVLPHPLDWSATAGRNTPGSISIRYPEHGAHGDIVKRPLEQGLEIAVEVSAPGTPWFEPRGFRFPILGHSWDRTRAGMWVRTLTGPSYGWLASKQLVVDVNRLLKGSHWQAGTWPFYQQTPGHVIRELMQNSWQSENQPFDLTFTDTVDSLGAPWAAGTADTRYVPYQASHLKILEGLADDEGAIDWWTQGRELVVVNREGGYEDRSATVKLDLDADVSSAPSSKDLTGLAEMVIFRGAGDLSRIGTGNAPAPWGYWQAIRTDERVTVPETADRMLAEAMSAHHMRQTYGRDLRPGSKYLPLVDFQVGDHVTAPGADGAERLRVVEIGLRSDGRQLIPSITLHDRHSDAATRTARRARRAAEAVEETSKAAHDPAPSIRATDPTGDNELFTIDDSGWKVRDAAGNLLLSADENGWGVTPWSGSGGGDGGAGTGPQLVASIAPEGNGRIERGNELWQWAEATLHLEADTDYRWEPEGIQFHWTVPAGVSTSLWHRVAVAVRPDDGTSDADYWASRAALGQLPPKAQLFTIRNELVSADTVRGSRTDITGSGTIRVAESGTYRLNAITVLGSPYSAGAFTGYPLWTDHGFGIGQTPTRNRTRVWKIPEVSP